MSVLDEYREKYPRYKDIDDQTLAGALYEKHYSDKLPLDEFMAQVIPKDRTWKDRIIHALGRTGRMTADAVAAFPLTAMDAGVGARNIASEISNLNREPLSTEPLKLTYPGYSKYYREIMDQISPPAEGMGEQIVDTIGQIAVGSKTIPNIGIKYPGKISSGALNNAQEIALTKARQQLPGRIAPATMPNAEKNAEKAIEAGARHNVPVYYDDVGGHISKKLGTATDQVPLVGTGGGRAVQQQAANKATEKLSNKFYVDENIPELVQEGLKTKLAGFKKTAGALYAKAADLLDPRGPVKTASFDDAITAQIQANDRLGTAGNKEVGELLEKYANAPRGNFSLMRELRSQLGREISDFYKGGSAVGEQGVGALQAVKNGLEKDMAQFADDAGGAAKQAWRKADSFYRKGIVPFKQSGLKQLVKTDEPQKAWRYLVQQSAGPERSVKMYTALSPDGRAAVRSGLIQDAMEQARIEKTGDISPAKFAQYMEKHSNAINTFFKGKDLQEIKGFQNLMRHIERAGQYAENPPTGNRVVTTLAAGGAAIASLPTVLKIAGGTYGIKTLFQTTKGRNLLMAAAKAKPGSPAMEQLGKYVAAAVATESKD